MRPGIAQKKKKCGSKTGCRNMIYLQDRSESGRKATVFRWPFSAY